MKIYKNKKNLFNFKFKKLTSRVNLFILAKNNINTKKVNWKKNSDFFIIVKKESIVGLNNCVDFKIKNFKKNSNFNLSLLKKNKLLFYTSNLVFKNKLLSILGRKKLEVYSLINMVFSLKEDFLTLIQHNLGFNYFNNNALIKETLMLKILLNFFVWNLFGVKTFSIYYPKYFIKLNTSVSFQSFFLQKSQLNSNFSLIILMESSLKKRFLYLICNEFKKSNVTLNKLVIKSYFKSFFEGRVENFNSLPLHFLNYIYQNFYKNYKNVIRSIWKKNYSSLIKINSNLKQKNFGKIKYKSIFFRFLSKNIIFLLFKLKEKNNLIFSNLIAKKRVLLLNNFLISKIKNKIFLNKSKSFTVSSSKFKLNTQWNFVFKKKILPLLNKINSFSGTNSLLYTSKIKKYKKTKKLNWKEKKLKTINSILNSNQLNSVVSQILKTNISLFFINALGLAQFSFFLTKKNKLGRHFLRNIDNNMISRYKYIAVYIQDLIRISFISLFFKNPTFLANFIGFQIAKLPKNRKETKLLKFIIKLVKIFSLQRKEMLGIKIEFKGRVNRWRRTKILGGIGGLLPSLYDYENRIEFGSSKSITRKGALGIRLWFCYKSEFNPVLRNCILKYFLYSKYLHLYTVKNFLKKYKSK